MVKRILSEGGSKALDVAYKHALLTGVGGGAGVGAGIGGLAGGDLESALLGAGIGGGAGGLGVTLPMEALRAVAGGFKGMGPTAGKSRIG